jgi:hypothetical protein
MPEWFVYNNTQYYPWAEIVEADTPEQAVDIVTKGRHDEGAAVFPVDALAAVAEGPGRNLLEDLRRDGADSRDQWDGA